MPATTYRNTAAAALVYGMTDETSIIVESLSRTVNAVKAEVRNAANDVCAVSYSGLTASVSIEGYVNGTVSMDVAAAVTLTNAMTAGGVSGGTIIVDTYAESQAQGQFKKLSVSLTQYSETMTAS